MGTGCSSSACCAGTDHEVVGGDGGGRTDAFEVPGTAKDGLFAALSERDSSPGIGSTIAPPSTGVCSSLRPPSTDASPTSPPKAASLGEVRTGPLGALGAGLEEVRSLARSARIFEAASALDRVEREMRQLEPTEEGDREAMEQLAEELKQDPVVTALRSTNARMRATLSKLGPGTLPGGPDDRRWVHTALKDKAIHDDFAADIYIRFATGAEKDPGRSHTQIITCGYLTSFPMDIDKFVSVYRETDLYKKEWLADCERCEGEVGGPEKLHSALSHIVNASPMLPVRLDIVTVREFAICCGEQSPLGDRGPGVLIQDMGAPHDAKSFAGWQLPPHASRSTRLSALSMVLYFTPSKSKAGFVDVLAVGKVGVPLPSWIIPLSLIKRFLANHFMSVFKAIKMHIVDEWDQLGYEERIKACPEFYNSAMTVKQQALSPA